jgi:hypothetical protein
VMMRNLIDRGNLPEPIHQFPSTCRVTRSTSTSPFPRRCWQSRSTATRGIWTARLSSATANATMNSGTSPGPSTALRGR